MGRQLTEENDPNYQTFLGWMARKTNTDYRQMVTRGVLNRDDIAEECGFSKSVLNQNPRVKGALRELEKGLRKREILPPLVEKPEPVDGELPMRPSGAGKVDALRLRRLENDNAALKAKLQEYEEKLGKYGLLEKALDEAGRIPR